MQFNLKESIQVLAKTPLVIECLLKGLPDQWIKTNEGNDTWSPFDILGHLIHGEKTDWIPRVRIILDKKSSKPFEPFDRFAQFENSKGKTLNQLLNEFNELRKENIQYIETLDIDEESLKKTGIHPEFGHVTLRQLLATWVTHDLGHLNQMTRVMAKNYKIEAGPWSKYIAVIQD